MTEIFDRRLLLVFFSIIAIGPFAHSADGHLSRASRSFSLSQGDDIEFTHLSTKEGLSNNRVSAVIQDDQGFIWFGLEYGLSRYDGYSFKVFRHDRNPGSLGGGTVRALFKDRSGKLWIAVDQYLDRFDPESETFIHYQSAGEKHSGPGGIIFSVCQDQQGLLWLATSQGLTRFDPASGKFKSYRHVANDPASLDGGDLTSVVVDNKGLLWVISAHGLDAFDPQTEKATHYLQFHYSELESALGGGTRLYMDRGGALWVISTSGSGLSTFDPATRKLRHYAFLKKEPDSSTQAGVESIYEDQDGIFWLGTAGNGLIKFDRKRNTFTRYWNQPGVPGSLSDNFVLALFEDREGSIWAGTGGGGVNRFRREPPPARRYRKEPANPNSLDANYVLSVYEDTRGVLWIGNDQVLNRLDRRTRRYTFYRHNRGDYGSISNGSVTSAVEDHSGILWFGTYGGGLDQFDRKTGRFKAYRSNPENKRSLSSDRVLKVFLDHAGILWLGTGEGLDRFDPKRESFIKFRQDRRSPIRQIVEDRTGSLWLGTIDGGISNFAPATGQFTNYRHDPNSGTSLSNDHVNALCIDKSGMIWVGTNNGLNRFDPETRMFTAAYFENSGLPSDTIQGIQEDERGYLWVSTSNGVSRFHPQTGEFKNYYESDGLAGNDFGLFVPVSFKSRSGEIFLGGVDGVTAFYPAQLGAVHNSYVPPVVLTGFRLNNTPVPIGGDSMLKKSISLEDSLTLSHKQNIFSLEFAALSYLEPAENRYRYKLEGLESEWNETSSAHRLVAYTTLPPGAYVFRVQGSNNRGVWNENGAKIRIRILPPWWSTWWFRTSIATLFVLSLWYAYLIRIRILARDFEMSLEVRVEERTRIARELHDTLLQSFHGLLLRFQTVYALLPGHPDAAKRSMAIAIDQAAGAITEGRDAVHNLRSPTLESNDLAVAIRSIGETLSAHEMNRSAAFFEVQIEGTPRNLHPILRDEIYLIASEALRNAFRHAQARRIEVEIRYDNTQFRLRIRDDGKGIEMNVLGGDGRAGHYGLPGMRERAKLIGGKLTVWSEIDSGTEAELSIPGSIAYVASARHSWLSEKLSWKRNPGAPID